MTEVVGAVRKKGIARKGGKRSRKLNRRYKRERYEKSFLDRYGISRAEWVEWKKNHSPQEVHQKRIDAIR